MVAEIVAGMLCHSMALVGGKYMRWQFLDPVMGIVGAVMILRWTWMLLHHTSGILLDREMDAPLVGEIRRMIEADGDTRISDIHLWRVGQEAYACIVALVARQPRDPAHYKSLLAAFPQLVHVTIEPHACADAPRESEAEPVRR
jgi:Co/Zn/Cd efflux system component